LSPSGLSASGRRPPRTSRGPSTRSGDQKGIRRETAGSVGRIGGWEG
jgi:hypothetical protein